MKNDSGYIMLRAIYRDGIADELFKDIPAIFNNVDDVYRVCEYLNENVPSMFHDKNFISASY